MKGRPYFEWILNGLDLYDEIAAACPALELIEVFPTASWTRWSGKKGKRSRASWSGAALDALKLENLPTQRLNQDDRDAIAAAVTAWLHTQRETDSFGSIVVPKPRSWRQHGI